MSLFGRNTDPVQQELILKTTFKYLCGFSWLMWKFLIGFLGKFPSLVKRISFSSWGIWTNVCISHWENVVRKIIRKKWWQIFPKNFSNGFIGRTFREPSYHHQQQQNWTSLFLFYCSQWTLCFAWTVCSSKVWTT